MISMHTRLIYIYQAARTNTTPTNQECQKIIRLSFKILKEAKSILNNWSNKKINEKSDECVTWWSEYKNNLRNSIYRKIIT